VLARNASLLHSEVPERVPALQARFESQAASLIDEYNLWTFPVLDHQHRQRLGDARFERRVEQLGAARGVG